VSRFLAGKLICGKLYVRTQGGNWLSLTSLIEMNKAEGCH
jgi:hypothetical protein